MKYILIAKSNQEYKILIDDDDYDIYVGKTIYLHPKGYASIWSKSKRKHTLLHREIMNTPKGLDTDHINGNKLDNRKSNLRVCTHSINIQNQNGRSKSGYKGVTKNGKYWQANIFKDGVKYHLGTFRYIPKAVEAYNKKALELYGSSAFVNILRH